MKDELARINIVKQSRIGLKLTIDFFDLIATVAFCSANRGRVNMLTKF